VELPGQFSRPHVKGSHVTRGPAWLAIRNDGPSDDEILKDDGWRSDAANPIWKLVGDTSAKINRSSLAELGCGLASAAVQSKQPSVQCA
jgi:hypothetical protein